LEDLEKAAKDQGYSYEDFKANIRNQIVTQQVMRQEVGRKLNFTQGEVERFYEAHKQDYAKPESVQLSEILVSTGADPDDAGKAAAGKAKADDIEAKLHAGGDFSQLAKTFSDGTTAAEGGAFGTFHRGELAKVFEDATFNLKAGQFTDPIRTKQGYIVFRVDDHIPGGIPPYKSVMQDVEQNFYESLMVPKMREYLTQMREEAYVYVKDGYTDTGASPNEIKPVYSVYTPPTAKKKKKVERTRFRETTRTFRQKSTQTASAPTAAAPVAVKKDVSAKVEKPGKKEKIRFGKAPTKTLPAAASSATEDAGAGAPPAAAAAAAPEPANPLEASNKPTEKTRFSSRPKTPKANKASGAKTNSDAPPPPDAAEVADRQEQAAALGLNGDTSAKKKKKTQTTTGEKTRLADQNKKTTDNAPAPPPEQPAPAPSAPPPAAPPVQQ
jgi:peptidyl-prolyl cis-trans isomerase SurA